MHEENEEIRKDLGRRGIVEADVQIGSNRLGQEAELLQLRIGSSNAENSGTAIRIRHMKNLSNLIRVSE